MKGSEVRTVYIQAPVAEISDRVNAWLESHADAEIVKIKAIASQAGLEGVFIIYRAAKEARPVGFARE